MKLDDKTIKRNFKSLCIFIFTVVIFAIFILRLFYLQIIHGTTYLDRATQNSASDMMLSPQRGEIYDRNATVPMVINTDSFAVDLTPGNIPKGYYDTVASKLSEYLGISKQSIDEKIPPKRRNSYKAYEIRTNVSLSVISNIAENITDLPGISWRNRPTRTYLDTNSISHILGYVGPISSDELKYYYNHGYTANSMIGKIGIERQYDSLLKGKPGKIVRTVDVHGRVLNDIAEIQPPESGKNLVLTIDSSIQQLAEKALGDRTGSIVVLKPSNGEILAMVSYPYFDPNIMSSDQFSNEYVRLTKDPAEPLLNRSINGLYPPASTFKTVMTAAILNENAFPPEKKIKCEGSFFYGDRVFHCHEKIVGHGYLDLKNGLAQSCDIYYWVVGRDYLGIDIIADYSRKFGFGQNLEIDLPSYSAGLVPTPKWKRTTSRAKWNDGDTMNVSIGQGNTLVTPLHIANMMAMVCNSGTIYKPHLLKEVRDPSTNKIVKTVEKEILHTTDISPDVWKQVQYDLRYTMTDGTPSVAMANKSVQIAGKTGTAEVGMTKQNTWHSWVIAYAPYNAPVEEQVVVATLVEASNGWEWWSPYATNIVFQGIFNNQTFEEAVDALKYRYLVNRRNQGANRE